MIISGFCEIRDVAHERVAHNKIPTKRVLFFRLHTIMLQRAYSTHTSVLSNRLPDGATETLQSYLGSYYLLLVDILND